MKTTRILILAALLAMAVSGCRKKADTPETPNDRPSATSPSGQQASPSTEPADMQTQPALALTEPADTSEPQPASQTTEPAAGSPDRTVREQQPVTHPQPAQIADDAWTMDFAAAKAKARAEKKDLLINFSGSDWCGWCIKLDSEVFSKQAFLDEAKKHFVLVVLDFPRDTSKLPQQIRQQNARLAEHYRIQGYPTVILADATGRPYAATGYREGGVEPYLAHLQELRDAGGKIQDLLKRAATVSDPLEKAGMLDRAMELLDPEIADRFYAEQIDQIVKLDADNAAGLKNKYVVRKRFADVDDALARNDYEKALALLDDMLKTLTLEAGQIQELQYARAHALHFLQRADDEKQALEKALAADPDSPMAEHLRRVIDRLFPPTVRPGRVETTMSTYQQFVPEKAFDGDPDTYFWSNQSVPANATLTITLDNAQTVQQIQVVTGDPTTNQFGLTAGVLEVSADGATFEKVADFADAAANADLAGKTIKAVRLRCTQPHPLGLVIREITLK